MKSSTKQATDAHIALLIHALSILSSKRMDYSGKDDPLRNFRNAENLGVHPVIGVMVRLSDKVSRVASLVEQGTSGGTCGEAVIDTLADVMNYAGIALGLLMEDDRFADICMEVNWQQLRDILSGWGYEDGL